LLEVWPRPLADTGSSPCQWPQVDKITMPTFSHIKLSRVSFLSLYVYAIWSTSRLNLNRVIRRQVAKKTRGTRNFGVSLSKKLSYRGLNFHQETIAPRPLKVKFIPEQAIRQYLLE
jgi:hypothetical protein